MSASAFDQPLDALRLAALKRRCRRTQQQVYETYVDAAWTLALRLTGCEAGAWDVVQEAFIRTFGRIDGLREPLAFGPWLRRIVVNQAMDQYRRRGCDSHADPPEASLQEACDDSLDLERALARLPAPDRMVLWLHDAEGLTHDEIAERAGRTRSWSKSRLVRARAKARKMLEPVTTRIQVQHG